MRARPPARPMSLASFLPTFLPSLPPTVVNVLTRCALVSRDSVRRDSVPVLLANLHSQLHLHSMAPLAGVLETVRVFLRIILLPLFPPYYSTFLNLEQRLIIGKVRYFFNDMFLGCK